MCWLSYQLSERLPYGLHMGGYTGGHGGQLPPHSRALPPSCPPNFGDPKTVLVKINRHYVPKLLKSLNCAIHSPKENNYIFYFKYNATSLHQTCRAAFTVWFAHSESAEMRWHCIPLKTGATELHLKVKSVSPGEV